MNPLVRITVLCAALAGLVSTALVAMAGREAWALALAGGVAVGLGLTLGAGALVRRLYAARPADASSAPGLVRLVAELASDAGVPAPSLWLVEDAAPGAFATGITPRRAAIVLTTGLVGLLTARELRAVIAHELAHIRRRDTGAAALCVVLAGALPLLALAVFGAFSLGDDEGEDGTVPAWLLAVLAPLSALLLGLALDAAREFDADRDAARLCGDPHALADALARIEQAAARRRLRGTERHPQTSALLVVPTAVADGLPGARATQPDTAMRIERLRAQAAALVG